MASITLHDASGASTGTVELDDATFGIEPNVAVMHQVVTAQLAEQRAQALLLAHQDEVDRRMLRKKLNGRRHRH